MRAVGIIVIWPVLNFIIPVLNVCSMVVCSLVLRHNICKFWQKKEQNLFKPGIKPKDGCVAGLRGGCGRG
jgi:hypothetical protein